MHRLTRLAAVVLLAAVAFAAVRATAAPDSRVPYPTGYRSWTHLKSMAIVSDQHPLANPFAGLHHVYVNAVGLDAARRGGEFPNGSVIVFDLLQADAKDGAITEGARKFIGVMRKDRKAYAATGGWGWEGFEGDSRDRRMVKDAAGQCFQCHTSQKSSDYVFSRYRP